MKITSLELKNIRSYDEEKVNFPEGSVLLSGDIGHGKSTLLLAIEFAFFGIKRGELTGDELLREGQKSGEVKLEFAIDGKDYTIMRSLKRTKTNVVQDSGYLITDGLREDLQPEELKARILERLGYPKELISKQKSYIYRYTVYTPQEEMKNIVLADEESRLETLRKIFGIKKYKLIRDNASAVRSELRGHQRQLSGIAERIDEKKGELKDLKKDVKELEKKFKEAKGARDKIQKELNEHKKKLVKVREEFNKFNELKNKKTKTETEKKNEEKRLEKIGEEIGKIHDKIKELGALKKPTDKTEEELDKKLKKLEEKKEGYLKDKKGITKEIDELLKKIEGREKELDKKLKKLEEKKEGFLKDKKGITKEIDELLKKIEDGKNGIEKIDGDVNTSKGIITQLGTSIEELEQAGNTCPVCGSKLTKAHKDKEIEKNNKKIQDAQKKIESLKDKKKKTTEQIKGLEEAVEERIKKVLENVGEEIKELKAKEQIKGLEEAVGERIKKVLENVGEKIKELKDLSKKAKEYNQSVKRKKEHQEDIKEKKGEEKEATKNIKESEKNLGEIEKSLKKYEGIEEKEKKINDKVEEIQSKINEASRVYTGAESDIKNKSEYIKKLNEEIKKKENAKKLEAKLSVFENWLDEYLSNLSSTIERHFMLHLQKKFNSVFGGWYNQLVEDECLTVRVNDQFTLVIEREGYETQYRHLSGGEKTSVALAYRLALNTVINSLIEEIKTNDLIILDEPTDGFSTNQLDRIRDVIHDLGMKQTILVSHEPKMEGYVDNIITIYKENGVSHVRC